MNRQLGLNVKPPRTINAMIAGERVLAFRAGVHLPLAAVFTMVVTERAQRGAVGDPSAGWLMAYARDLDRLATAALRETARRRRKIVERDVVIRVIEADARERGR
ncbi:MAG: hypothetical protein R3B48_15055 [Kofleriaceae bacterium]